MFFSPELLARRDSGFGLLWLAATLGSKSSFKKLPRRSIQTADIPQLCNLISHPSEPLALRLSSNLMVGVARVFKIKHEIFITDVSNCFVHLKKIVQEIHAFGAPPEAQLQMGQPSVRPDTLTLTADPTIAVTFEFDAFADWTYFSGFGTQRQEEDEDEFVPGTNKSKLKFKGKSKASLNPPEAGRHNLHTLDENHEYLLSTSFDANGSFLAGIDPSSSQVDPALRFGSFGFDNNIFGADDNFDMGLGDIGDELARELGEGWGGDISSAPAVAEHNFTLEEDFDMGIEQNFDNFDIPLGDDTATGKTPQTRKRPFTDSDKENLPPVLDGAAGQTPRSIVTHQSQFSHPTNDNQDDIPELVETVPTHPLRRPKKVRIQLDTRTDLSDEELKAAREHYVELQRAARLEKEKKQLEKEGDKALEDLIWGIPQGLVAPALTDFWSQIYKIQVESRSGNIYIDDHEARAAKRQKRSSPNANGQLDIQNQDQGPFNLADDYAPMEYDFGINDGDYNAPLNFGDDSRIRSSEEPERGRDAGLHVASQLGFDDTAYNPSSGTQRSAFFPWDNAAGASSSTGVGFAPAGSKSSDRVSLDHADVRIVRSRSRSGSRSGSFSIIPSQNGSMIGLNFGMSPSGQRVSAIGDDFQFDVSNDGGLVQDTQEAENNIVTLERTSFNFLEYCKMQAQGLPGNQKTLNFDDIVPPVTSTRHVAAAAFHHCLALATKDLISVKQDDAYAPLSIRIN